MKKGKKYEDFVYKIFSDFFKEFSLKQNDKIKGNKSGLNREIDVSIRGKVDNVDLLFIVQAKEYKRTVTFSLDSCAFFPTLTFASNQTASQWQTAKLKT
jgi:hypothetical protein